MSKDMRLHNILKGYQGRDWNELKKEVKKLLYDIYVEAEGIEHEFKKLVDQL